jgi:uncharacterized membrane protein YhdT
MTCLTILSVVCTSVSQIFNKATPPFKNVSEATEVPEIFKHAFFSLPLQHICLNSLTVTVIWEDYLQAINLPSFL